MKKIKLTLLMASVLCLGAFGTRAKADSIEFLGNSGGSLSFSPVLGHTLSLSSVPVDLAERLPGLTTATLTATLNLVTGTLATITTIGTSHVYSFNSGGTLSITQGLTTLLSATFSPGTTFTVSSGAGTFAGALNVVSVDPGLLASLGFPSNGRFSAGADFQFVASVTAHRGVLTGGVTTSVVNSAQTVPEGSSLLLLGTGLLGLAALYGRKRGFGRSTSS